MINKEYLKKNIEEIRGLLTKNEIHKAYDKLISLNEFSDDIDNYTCYFANSLDDGISDFACDFNEDEENGTIMVEAVLGGYIPAKASDIEDTLKEIEIKFL